MVTKLARLALVVLVATSVAAAGVLGSVPRCSQTGAVAGSKNCCCASHGETATPASCCQPAPETRSCCSQAPPAAAPSLARSACCCSIAVPLAAVTSESDRVENREHLWVVLAAGPPAAMLLLESSVRGSNQRLEPLKIPLRKMYCRWTV